MRGAWIETYRPPLPRTALIGRAPCGARGLKLVLLVLLTTLQMSRPVRGAWIETRLIALSAKIPKGSNLFDYV